MIRWESSIKHKYPGFLLQRTIWFLLALYFSEICYRGANIPKAALPKVYTEYTFFEQ